jgi:uncharacterized membrane protein YcaP (DUF421 family)
MWAHILPHWWHFVVRSAIVYAFLLILLRCTGKRQVGQLAPFDLVLLLVLANAVQNAMVGGDNSITGAFLAAGTLVGLNWVVSWLTFHNRKLEALIEGRPVVIIHNGHIDRAALRGVQMTIHELEAALRCEGHAGPESVRFAVLENNGELTVIGKHNKSGT